MPVIDTFIVIVHWLANVNSLEKNPLFIFSCFLGSSSTCTYYMYVRHTHTKVAITYTSRIPLCTHVL